MATKDWYSTPEGLKTVREFHDAYAREPAAEIAEAKKRHPAIIDEIKAWLTQNGNQLKRTEYTGSAYEGLKIGKELEFDVMFILNKGEQLDVKVDQKFPRYAKLDPKGTADDSLLARNVVSGHLSPGKVRSRFNSDLQKWLNKRQTDNPQLQGEITLHYGGAAITAKIFRRVGGGWRHWYDVDLVPTYEVNHTGKKKLYVAKPLDEKNPNDLTWRHSFSVKEKALLSNIDSNNQCRKQVIRIIKVIRDREPGLDKLVSFYIKNAVIMLSREKALDWSVPQLAVRLRDSLDFLSTRLMAGDLRHPSDSSINILIGLDKTVRENMGYRLRRLINSEQEARRMFADQLAGQFSNLKL